MRDIVAGIVAVALLLAAASLATALQALRGRRQRARDAERALGRRIIAEIPAGEDLVLFSEDAKRFYYGERSIDKDLIVASRILINGAPIAESVAQGAARLTTSAQAAVVRRSLRRRRKPRAPGPRAPGPGSAVAVDERPDGIARDRWDVAIETAAGTTLIECGSIRERVSQEIARAIFNAVSASVGGRP